MARLLSVAGGRRAKWFVVSLWLVLVLVSGLGAAKFEDVQKNDNASFLPGKAESVKALNQLKRYPSGNQVAAIAVYHRPGGLTPADRARLRADAASLRTRPIRDVVPSRPPVISRDDTTALLVPRIEATEGKTLSAAAKELRARLDRPAAGLQIRVTGPAGFSADAIKVFSSINGTLLLATALLVFVLLIAIYRSPIFWVIPFFCVMTAEVMSRGLGYAIAKAGVTVNGQSSGILGVLVFGAGTDYALLLVARYREELRRHEDKHEAMRVALRSAGPAILASGLTVIAALLCLTLAEVNGIAGLGPIGAMGVALAMVAMLTILPALLVISGRRAFWPFVPRVGEIGADETHGVWRRVGERVAARPARVGLGVGLLLLLFCLGLTQFNTGLTQGSQFRGEVESVQGQKLLAAHFPAGASATTDVVVPRAGAAPAVARALAGSPGVAAVQPVEQGAPGAHLSVTLRDDPYSQTAFERIDRLRQTARAAGGADVLVGGGAAIERDLRRASSRDSKVIPPIVLVVVLLILMALLRAVVGPLVLVATVVLSYGATLGLSAVVFKWVFGFPGSDPSLPLFAFIFLVALGVDYNIFLMARVREETLTRGTQQGMLRGIAVTGAVITSAGVVLAGTFSTLAVLPLVPLTEIGFAIALGVLLDTFLVRSVLVPALGFMLDRRLWWPSALGRPRAEAGEGEPGVREPAPAVSGTPSA